MSNNDLNYMAFVLVIDNFQDSLPLKSTFQEKTKQLRITLEAKKSHGIKISLLF